MKLTTEKILAILQDPPNDEDLRSWRSNRCTTYFKALLVDMREEMKEDIVKGLFTGDTVDKTALLTAEAVGKCAQLEDTVDTLELMGEEETTED